MSYLSWPRLHFAGRFQADTSTINNDVRHYKSDAFLPQFQAPMVGHGGGGADRTNGYWNPEGTGAWRMVGCRVTSVALPGRRLTADTQDGAVGLRLGGSSDRVAAKLVDLDPQQQLASQIWGLRVTLIDARGETLLDSRYEVGTFTDLWKRQQIPQNFDQTLGAAFQSTLCDLTWGDLAASPALGKLRAASRDGLLSIRFNTFGFDRDPTADDYTTGVVIGTIGPAARREPRFFVAGRQLVAATPADNPFGPLDRVYGFQAVDHPRRRALVADLGNALPIVTAAGDFLDIGALELAVARRDDITQGQTVTDADVAILGEVPYRTPGWYQETAGVVDFAYGKDPWLCEHIAQSPLMLVQRQSEGLRVLVRETAGGLYARADAHVFRLDPGASATVDYHATRYGRPTALTLALSFDDTIIGGAGTGATLNAERWPVPAVGVPTEAIAFPASLAIPKSGRARLRIRAARKGPGRPRGYLDGQVYGIGQTIADAPPGYLQKPLDFVSVLIWDAWRVPDKPTWHRDIRPIFEQYGNLYPIMSRHLVDLGDYDSVVRHLRALVHSFALPVADPNSMPVSRDLSANKRAGILKWLTTPGPDGLPLRGEPAAYRAPPPPRYAAPPPQKPAAAAPPEPGGKLDYLMQAIATQTAKKG